MDNDLVIIKRGVKKQLWTEPHRSPFGYRITISGVMTTRNDYINIDIMIDQHIITFYTHKDFKRVYLHYFHYNSDEKFENGNNVKYDLYLSVNDVLDGREFFTTTIIERRKLKIKHLKEKLEKKLEKV